MANAFLQSLLDFLGFFLVGTILLGAVAFPPVYGIIVAMKYGIRGQPTDREGTEEEIPSKPVEEKSLQVTSQPELPSKRAA